MEQRLVIVTGAPGAGKSATVEAFLALRTAYIALDIDWLAQSASDLAGRSILHDPRTWRPYRVLWLEVMQAILRNGQVPVLFAAIDQDDVAEAARPEWWKGIDWMLLDCSDARRRERLQGRPGWTAAMIDEALADAAVLRAAIGTAIDTGVHPPREVAARLIAWLDRRR